MPHSSLKSSRSTLLHRAQGCGNGFAAAFWGALALCVAAGVAECRASGLGPACSWQALKGEEPIRFCLMHVSSLDAVSKALYSVGQPWSPRQLALPSQIPCGLLCWILIRNRTVQCLVLNAASSSRQLIAALSRHLLL